MRDGDDFYRVGVPIGARLHIVVRRRGGWEVWMGLGDRHMHPDHYVGHFLFLHDDGQVERVIRDDAGIEDRMLVKGKDL